MEITNDKISVRNTKFNENINKQFVPYWNGLLHLVGKIENGVLIRRYDWENIIKDCENFEKDYLNTLDFCENCMFSELPSYLDNVIQTANQAGVYDCKQIAQDNDIIFSYCDQIQKTKKKLTIFIGVLVATVIILVVVFYFKLQTNT